MQRTFSDFASLNFGNFRNEGSGFFMVIAPATLLLALGAALATMSTVQSRSVVRSIQHTRAFYLADSGAQAGNALVRDTGPTMESTSFSELIDGHTAVVDIEELDPGIFRVTSTASIGGEESTVELHVVFESEPFGLQNALQLSVDNDVTIHNDIDVSLASFSRISGFDHENDGTQKADQADGKPGVGVHSLPGGEDLDVTLVPDGSGYSGDDDDDDDSSGTINAVVEGTPVATTENNDPDSSKLETLVDHAKNYADVLIGPGALGNSETGAYGTAGDPKIVYVDLGDNNTLTLHEGFTGHGTLVVHARTVSTDAAVKMLDSASWNGLVIVEFDQIVPFDPGSGDDDDDDDDDSAPPPGPDSLVTIEDSSRVVGGVAMLFEGGELGGNVSTGDDDDDDDDSAPYTTHVLKMDDNASILYSSDLIETTPGVGGIPPTRSSVVSFRTK